MTPPATPASRSLSWDVVRVVAVLSVVVQHATYTVSGVLPFLAPPPFVWPVEAGANVLMVVSGFFLCVTLAKRRAGGWWWHRMARLIPAYLVAVVLTYLATLVAAGYGYGWRPGLRDLVGNLLLVQSWDPRVTPLDGSYWTLPLQVGVFTVAALAVAASGLAFWRRPGVLPATVDGHRARAGAGCVRDRPTAGPGRRPGGLPLAALRHRARDVAGPPPPHLGAPPAHPHHGRGRHCSRPTPSPPPCSPSAASRLDAPPLGPDWTLLRVGPLPRILSWMAGISFGIYLLNQQIGYFAAWALQAGAGITGWSASPSSSDWPSDSAGR